MSDRHKPHNGRDSDGHFRVKRVDVDETQNDPEGEDFIRDDVRTGGAVADIGAHAGERAKEIAQRIAENRDDVRRLTGH